MDENAIYTYSSPNVKELLGYDPSEVVGKTIFDLMAPEEVESVASDFEAMTENPEPLEGLETVHRHKEGRLVVLETSGIPIIDDSGRFRGYRGIDRRDCDGG